MSREIKLTQGMVAIVDDEDFERVNNIRWFASKNGRTFYAMKRQWIPDLKSRKSIYMHRLVMNAPPGMEIDHINNNGLDNRKSNLRLCDRAINNQNRRRWR